MQRHIIMCVLIAIVWQSAQSQILQSTAETISLQDARRIALENNSQYKANEANLNAAKWGKTSALSSMMPSLSLGGTYLYMDPATQVTAGNQSYSLNHDMRTISLNLSQPLFLGGKLYQAYKIASASQQMADLSLRSSRIALYSELESKFYSVLQLQDLQNISKLEAEQEKKNLELATLKLNEGLISRADYLRFQSPLANKELALIQSDTALQLALKDFNNYLGADTFYIPENVLLEDEDIEAFSVLSLQEITAFTNNAIELAKGQNYSLQIIDKSLELAHRAYKIAKASFYPTVMLTGSRQYKENGIDRYEFDASNQIMLNVSIPLLPYINNHSAARKAHYETVKAELEAKTAVDGIALGVESAAISLISKAKQVKTALLALSYTTEMYEQLWERYRLNMISGTELLDAELMLSASRMAYNTAFYDFFKARLALATALGTEEYSAFKDLIQN